MIIEIKGLPAGQKIKKILIDISFDSENSGEAVEVQINEQEKTQIKNQEIINNKPVAPKDKEANREPPPIPQEMLDIEF